MGLTTLLTQIVSLLRANLWKVVVKFKNIRFFLLPGFRLFFQNICFWGCYISFRIFLIQPIRVFSGSIYKIQFFHEAIFLLAALYIIAKSTTTKKTKSQWSSLLIQTTVFLKYWSQTDKDDLNKKTKKLT